MWELAYSTLFEHTFSTFTLRIQEKVSVFYLTNVNIENIFKMKAHLRSKVKKWDNLGMVVYASSYLESWDKSLLSPGIWSQPEQDPIPLNKQQPTERKE